jgi:myosin protein heavy chain/myosin heavy chain 6/7
LESFIFKYHSIALQVVQRNLRKYLQLRTWAWYRLWQKVKPLLNVTRVEDEIKALEDKAAAAQASFEKEEKMRKELEINLAKMEKEKNDLMNRLQAESGSVQEFQEKQAKLMSQKADLESQLNVRTCFYNYSLNITYKTGKC